MYSIVSKNFYQVTLCFYPLFITFLFVYDDAKVSGKIYYCYLKTCGLFFSGYLF
jgi:hypothetical protein